MTIEVPGDPRDPQVPVGGLLGRTAALTVPVSGEELKELLSFDCCAVFPVAVEDFEPWPAAFGVSYQEGTGHKWGGRGVPIEGV